MEHGHDKHQLGDFSHYGDPARFGNSGNSGGKKNSGINSDDYHFHDKIQKLEDGIIEQWKEQNKSFNKNRTQPISSISDAKYRKLYTSMIGPVSANMAWGFILIFIVPLFFSLQNDLPYVKPIGIFVCFVLFINILFDAMIIYRVRKYVIEKVTNKYYQIIRQSWKSFEFIFVVMQIFAIIASIYFMFNPLIIQLENKHITKMLSYFSTEKYFLSLLITSIVSFFIYFAFIILVNLKAIKLQKIAIIESRRNSEYNADVAEQMLNGTLGDFEE